MDRYAEIVKQAICSYAAYARPQGDITTEMVFDEANGHFELLRMGWDGWRRIHSSIIHVDIRNGKIWVEHDGTEDGIANDLVEAGVPKEDIVLAFHPPTERKHTEFAVA